MNKNKSIIISSIVLLYFLLIFSIGYGRNIPDRNILYSKNVKRAAEYIKLILYKKSHKYNFSTREQEILEILDNIVYKTKYKKYLYKSIVDLEIRKLKLILSLPECYDINAEQKYYRDLAKTILKDIEKDLK